MDRMVAMLIRLGKRGYEVEEKSAEYLIDTDFDTDFDTDVNSSINPADPFQNRMDSPILRGPFLPKSSV